MTAAFDWFFNTFYALTQNLNFEITSGVGVLDFLVALTLIAIVVHNFVHIAR